MQNQRLRSVFTLSACTVALALAPVGADDIRFERILDGYANGVSDDGTVVVGERFGLEAFIWTLAGGLVDIGGVTGISAGADGSRIAGNSSSIFGESAARYNATTGTWSSFGGLGPTGCDSSLSSAYDLSSDGTKAVGLGWNGCSASAFLWTEGEGMTQLSQLGPFSSRADTISGDGTVIGGWDEASNGGRRAAVWEFDSASGDWVESLVLTGTAGNAEGYGEVNGSNGDGSILVGMADGSSSATSGAFVLREDTGFELIGLMPSSQFPVVGGALDVTEDGSTIIGFQREGAGGFSSFEATYWTEETGLVPLKDHLNALGAGIPAGFTLAAAQSISDDGRVICGWGYEDVIFFADAWIVVLPAEDVPCPADFNGDGTVDGADLTLLLVAWGTSDAAIDLDGNGTVDGADLTLFLSEWGDCG